MNGEGGKRVVKGKRVERGGEGKEDRNDPSYSKCSAFAVFCEKPI